MNVAHVMVIGDILVVSLMLVNGLWLCVAGILITRKASSHKGRRLGKGITVIGLATFLLGALFLL